MQAFGPPPTNGVTCVLALVLGSQTADLARVGVGEDDAAVVELIGALGMAKPDGAHVDRLLHVRPPLSHQLTRPPVKLIAWPVM